MSKLDKSNLISRRTVLGTAAAGAATLAMPGYLRAQSGPIQIGHLTPLTGFLGVMGEWASLGVQLAAEEINAAGGVLGRQVDVQTEDSINPENAATKAQRMIERDNKDVILGEISSASTLAIGQVAERNKKLFIATGPRSDVLRGESCNRYMFCTDIPNTVNVNVVGESLKRDNMVDGRKFFTLTADYVFGHDLLEAAERFFEANNAELVGNELIATDLTDFSPFILKIRQAQPDVVCLNLAGNQVPNFAKQYAEFGLPFPTVGFGFNTVDGWAAGPGNITGTWPAVWYHTLDVPASLEFVERFRAKFGKTPENHAWIDYIAMKILAKAMEETQSVDNEELVDYLASGAEFDILKNRKAYFRDWDHQLIQEAYTVTARDPDEVSDVLELMELGQAVPGPDQDLTLIYPTREQSGCSL
ncbi:ABC transporter substrate-binding protein [Pseudohoeflea coraliihabitans]|uniref:ABC transporter substrate-binding protein n=1 Tax=Pseudohoeflea coraliihabitans TaxID=2860393 RepID=A0ABS6WMQ3_9HYPH|nr:ABC transporter substrate-binding protein [Pseudohoeflea sp. DP4N28-3]MBW3097228.1 ABC transporter substrate-binding protein [Pseudohoeflea sp. DP4N28-3]